MQDRAPLYPGRVKLTPVAGQENTYDMTRADQPTQEGTPLNKDSLLKDATAALFRLGADAVPDDVLAVLSKAALVGGDDGNGFVTPDGSPILTPYIETGFYIGSGTSGSSHPNSISFKNQIDLVWIYGVLNSNDSWASTSYASNSGEKSGSTIEAFSAETLTNLYKNNFGPGYYYGSKYYASAKKSDDGKTIYWYTNGATGTIAKYHQLNYSGWKYFYVGAKLLGG